MLFFFVFVSPHLRPFAASSFSATRRLGYSSHQIISIFRPDNSFRMNTYFERFWRHLSPFRINTYEKGGEGWPVIVNQISVHGNLS